MGMQASLGYRIRYPRTLEAQSTREDTILRKQGLSYLHYTARRGYLRITEGVSPPLFLVIFANFADIVNKL